MSECEALPAGPREKGTLYAGPPLAPTWGTLRRLLWESDLRFGDPAAGCRAPPARTSRSRPSWGGETFQMAFEGPGWVLLQSSEGPTVPEHSRGGASSGGIGSFFGDGD